MPIAVFIDFFSKSKTRATKTMIVLQNLEVDDMLQCVDKGWDTKEESGVIFQFQAPSICCKFMIANQNFIMTFYYRKWHYVAGRLVSLE